MSKGQFQPSMANLGKICGTLQCQPGDLLHFVNDADDTDE
jgi:DNA-binding Xre family transcriptional regulator